MGDDVRYLVRQRALSIGHDFFVEDEHGDRAFRVDGKAFRLRKTAYLEDSQGRTLLKIQRRLLHLKESMVIEGPDGDRVALVQRALIRPLRDRWRVRLADAPDLRVQGNVVDHEYGIERDGVRVGEVSRRWFRVRDTYGVEITAGADVPLVLAVTIIVDAMVHAER